MITLMNYAKATYDEENDTVTISTIGDSDYEYPEITISVDQIIDISEKVKHERDKKFLNNIKKAEKK